MDPSKEKYPRWLFNYDITKPRMAEFLGIAPSSKLKKSEFIEQLKQKFEEDPSIFQRYHEAFREELSMSPYDVQQALGCTKTERKRWTDEERLHIVCYESVKSYGTYMEVPRYDRWQIEHELTPKVLAGWREEHKAKTSKNRSAGAKKAVKTRAKNDAERQAFQAELREARREWNRQGLELGAMLELAYWTLWCSRWAKEKEFKSRTARAEKYQDKYDIESGHYYDLKNEAIKVLAASKFAKISFYRPEQPGRVEIDLCENHLHEIADDMGVTAANINAAYFANPPKYDSCDYCQVYDVDPDYYSLYYLEIGNNDWEFSFHTPAGIGKPFMPEPDSLPRVEHEENGDGLFRFGRPIYESEMITHSEATVQKHFADALKKANLYIPNT